MKAIENAMLYGSIIGAIYSKKPMYIKTSIQMDAGDITEGEPFEDQIARMKENREPITDASVPLIYNAAGEENPEWDIRTDHMEWAQDKAEERLNQRKEFLKGTQKAKTEGKETDQKGEPTQEQGGGETTS